MTDYEREILCYLKDERISSLSAEAALSGAIESLQDNGLVQLHDECYLITAKGQAALEESD